MLRCAAMRCVCFCCLFEVTQLRAARTGATPSHMHKRNTGRERRATLLGDATRCDASDSVYLCGDCESRLGSANRPGPNPGVFAYVRT